MRDVASDAWAAEPQAQPTEVCFVLPVATLVILIVPFGFAMLRREPVCALNILNLAALGQREPERHDSCDV